MEEMAHDDDDWHNLPSHYFEDYVVDTGATTEQIEKQANKKSKMGNVETRASERARKTRKAKTAAMGNIKDLMGNVETRASKRARNTRKAKTAAMGNIKDLITAKKL